MSHKNVCNKTNKQMLTVNYTNNKINNIHINNYIKHIEIYNKISMLQVSHIDECEEIYFAIYQYEDKVIKFLTYKYR